MDCNYFMLVVTHNDSVVQELEKIGRPATAKLLDALNCSSKTVIAHIILTKIWDIGSIQMSEGYIYKDCNQLIGFHHMYNGLVWEWYDGIGDSIRQSEIDKIKNYWTKKIYKNVDLSFDYEKISSELMAEDAKRYPCNKVYENNSASIKYSELKQLLGRKHTNHLFNAMCSRLGNDSTTSWFDDCFFVSYGPEGLEFRFEKDSLLSTIFIKDSYKGGLPYDLLMSDEQKDIEKKLGIPEKTFRYTDHISYYYLKKGLNFTFTKDGKIENFYISND